MFKTFATCILISATYTSYSMMIVRTAFQSTPKTLIIKRMDSNDQRPVLQESTKKELHTILKKNLPYDTQWRCALNPLFQKKPCQEEALIQELNSFVTKQNSSLKSLEEEIIAKQQIKNHGIAVLCGFLIPSFGSATLAGIPLSMFYSMDAIIGQHSTLVEHATHFFLGIPCVWGATGLCGLITLLCAATVVSTEDRNAEAKRTISTNKGRIKELLEGLKA